MTLSVYALMQCTLLVVISSSAIPHRERRQLQTCYDDTQAVGPKVTMTLCGQRLHGVYVNTPAVTYDVSNYFYRCVCVSNLSLQIHVNYCKYPGNTLIGR